MSCCCEFGVSFWAVHAYQILECSCPFIPNSSDYSRYGQIFRIGTVRYAEGLWRMRRHGPVIAHCTDSEDFPRYAQSQSLCLKVSKVVPDQYWSGTTFGMITLLKHSTTSTCWRPVTHAQTWTSYSVQCTDCIFLPYFLTWFACYALSFFFAFQNDINSNHHTNQLKSQVPTITAWTQETKRFRHFHTSSMRTDLGLPNRSKNWFNDWKKTTDTATPV